MSWTLFTLHILFERNQERRFEILSVLVTVSIKFEISIKMYIKELLIVTMYLLKN